MAETDPKAGSSATSAEPKPGKSADSSEQTSPLTAAEKRQAALMGAAIAQGIAGANSVTATGETVDASRPPGDPEERLDFAPYGGVYGTDPDDDDAPLINAWSEEVNEEGDPIERKGSKGRRARRR